MRIDDVSLTALIGAAVIAGIVFLGVVVGSQREMRSPKDEDHSAVVDDATHE